MLAHVTNKARSARGFQSMEGATRFVEPGLTVLIDLADHALHRAWEAAGDVSIVRVSGDDPEGPSGATETARPSARKPNRARSAD